MTRREQCVFIDFQHDGRVEVNQGLDLEVRLENLLKFTCSESKNSILCNNSILCYFICPLQKIQIKTRWHETKQLKDAAICIDNVSEADGGFTGDGTADYE